MGLRPTLPMAGVSGNDLDGENVIPELLVINESERSR